MTAGPIPPIVRPCVWVDVSDVPLLAMRYHSSKPSKAAPAALLALALCLVPDTAAAGRTPGLGACTLMDAFLDRLMLAESGGDVLAKNPRSSALGPFQFIRSTFLEVSRRYFAEEVGELSEAEVLRLRTDLAFSRRVARAYSRQNAADLRRRGLAANVTNLRLAFFAGAAGAARVLTAKPEPPVSRLLAAEAVRANPFLYRMTPAPCCGDRPARPAVWGCWSCTRKRPGPALPRWPRSSFAATSGGQAAGSGCFCARSA